MATGRAGLDAQHVGSGSGITPKHGTVTAAVTACYGNNSVMYYCVHVLCCGMVLWYGHVP